MLSKLWLRSMLWLRQYWKWGVYMHSSWGHIPVYKLISLFWISKRRALRAIGASWRLWFSLLFSPKSPLQSKEKFSLFELLRCLALLLLNACSPSLAHKWKTSRGTRLATHASVTATNQGIWRKLWQIRMKVIKVFNPRAIMQLLLTLNATIFWWRWG